MDEYLYKNCPIYREIHNRGYNEKDINDFLQKIPNMGLRGVINNTIYMIEPTQEEIEWFVDTFFPVIVKVETLDSLIARIEDMAAGEKPGFGEGYQNEKIAKDSKANEGIIELPGWMCPDENGDIVFHSENLQINGKIDTAKLPAIINYAGITPCEIKITINYE